MMHIPFATMHVQIAPLLSRDVNRGTPEWGTPVHYMARIEPSSLVLYQNVGGEIGVPVTAHVAIYVDCPNNPLPDQVRVTYNQVSLPSLSVTNHYDPDGKHLYAEVIA